MRALLSPLGFLTVAAVAAGMACLSLAGCQPQHTTPTTQPQSLTPAERDFEGVWQASLDTLRSYHFQIDRQDRRAGVITTRPMTGMSFFEFWRKDAVRPADVGESTLQTIYRTATVTVRPVREGAETYQAQVEVHLRRSDRPTPALTDASQTYSRYAAGESPRRREAMVEAGVVTLEHTTDLGNDRALEARLTAEITAAADKLWGRYPASAPAATTAPATQPAGRAGAQ